ncbi:MAG: CZB domain-containing protein [Desulfomonilaceae bacterium]
MGNLDFVSAKLKHSTWKFKLRQFLNGYQQMPESEIISERECDLGKWLYSKGFAQYGKTTQMKLLEQAHAELHATAKKIIDLKHRGDSSGAEEQMTKLEALDRKLIDLLTDIENKV